MDIVRVSNGSGELLPHTVFLLDQESGNPTSQLISIKSMDDLILNVRGNNPVQPTPVFETAAILPGGAPGNHFIYVEFTRDIDVSSVLSDLPGGGQGGVLTGSILVTAFDPESGSALPVPGRAFINGRDLRRHARRGSAAPAPADLGERRRHRQLRGRQQRGRDPRRRRIPGHRGRLQRFQGSASTVVRRG